MIMLQMEPTAIEKQIMQLRRSITTFQGLRRRAKCRKLKKRYADLIRKYQQAEQKLLNVKP